ncbi:hypothetical protein J2849_006914 [Azospirillum melinis]|nr:hypothetical protein [Azospirillum melinis]
MARRKAVERCERCISKVGCYGSCARAPDGVAACLAAALRARGDELGEPDHDPPWEKIAAAQAAGERACKAGLDEDACPHGPAYDHEGFERVLSATWRNAWRLCRYSPNFTPPRHAQPSLPGLDDNDVTTQ